MQFITSIKLQEQEKQRLAYEEHTKAVTEADATGSDLIRKVEILLKTAPSIVYSDHHELSPSSPMNTYSPSFAHPQSHSRSHNQSCQAVQHSPSAQANDDLYFQSARRLEGLGIGQ